MGYTGAKPPGDFVADVQGWLQQKVSSRRANQLAKFDRFKMF